MKLKKVLLDYLYLVFFTLTLILAFNIKVFGDERIFNCTVTGHYKNPITGAVEDSGGESAMATGQGMVNGVVNKKGKLTIKDGKYYLDFTLSLAEFSSKHSFSDASTGAKVSCSLVGNGKDDNGKTNKYRAQIADENSVIRINMYVDPMGRSVVYFISVSNLKETKASKSNGKSDNAADTQNSTNVKNNVPQTPANTDMQPSSVGTDINAQQGADDTNIQGGNTNNVAQPNSYMPSNPYMYQNPYMQAPPNPYTSYNPYAPYNPYMPPNPYYMAPNPYVQGNNVDGQAGYGTDMQANPNGYTPNGYAPNPNMMYGEDGINAGQNINPNMTAVNPGMEYSSVYNSGTVKGLILSTDKEAEENVNLTAKPTIHFNKELLNGLIPGIIAFVISFALGIGVSHLKNKKSLDVYEKK